MRKTNGAEDKVDLKKLKNMIRENHFMNKGHKIDWLFCFIQLLMMDESGNNLKEILNYYFSTLRLALVVKDANTEKEKLKQEVSTLYSLGDKLAKDQRITVNALKSFNTVFEEIYLDNDIKFVPIQRSLISFDK